MIKLIMFISIFIQSSSYSFILKYNNGLGIIEQSYSPRKIKKRKVYISNNCKSTCMATENHNLKKCESKISQVLMSIKENGNFIQICLFKDNSSYIK